jgi:putative acetyltransferase
MFTIRPAAEGDAAAIRTIHLEAFGGPAEADLVDALRSTPQFIPELSLVAATAQGEALGHLLLTRVEVHGAAGVSPALALAPMGVRPSVQRQAIGSALVREGIHRARSLGHSAIIVLGHPAYYPRFGFVPARARGLDCQWPCPDEAFMVLELASGALEHVRGRVVYADPFQAL